MHQFGDSVLAVDIGGTKLETALVSAQGEILSGSRHRRPTGHAATALEVESRLKESIELTLAAALGPVVAAGVGSAGPLDLQTGTVSPHNMPGLRGFAVRQIVEQATQLPTTLRLDGTCIALGEHWLGAARGTSSSMALVVSTGVGGGIIADGRLIAGVSGNAGHIGQVHVAVDEVGDPTSITLEAVASGPSTVRWAQQRGWRGTTGEELALAVVAGDPVAESATRRSAFYVGQAIASVATLLDVEVVAIGGGFANVRSDYLDIVRSSVATNSVFDYARRVRVVASGHLGNGPLLGAAALQFCADMLSSERPTTTTISQ